jgi:type III secretory pathway component EscT
VASHSGVALVRPLPRPTPFVAGLPRLRLSAVQAGLVTGGVLYALGSYILPATLGDWVEPMMKSPQEKAMTAVTHAFYGVVFGLAYEKLTKRRRA